MPESLRVVKGWNSCYFPLHQQSECKESRRLALTGLCPALTVREHEGGGLMRVVCPGLMLYRSTLRRGVE